MNKKIAISGASGLIGTKLTPYLRERGYTIYRLVRRKPDEDSSEIYWNPETAEIDSSKLEGLDFVIHLAGMPLDGQRWTPKVKEAIYASRIKGTRLISEALAHLKTPPSLLISASATDYYADSQTPIGETEGQPGQGFMAEMCRDWESATNPANKAGIRVVLIRIPSVLASEGHSILGAFLPLFKRGLGPILGTGKQLMCFIALDDMIRAIEHIIICEQIVGPVNVLTPEPVTNAEFARILGKILRRPVFVRIPGFIMRLAMGEVANAIMAGDSHIRPDKLLSTGFHFDYPDIESALLHELAQ